MTGAVSVLSDGFHSLTDSGLERRRARRREASRSQPPDAEHPYGHRKFETMASVGFVLFLLLVIVQVLWTAGERLQSRGGAAITPLSFAVMGATLLINVGVVIYERRAGHRLSSEVLVADSHHTQSDLLTSVAVIRALVGVKLGYPLLDPIAAIVVAVFIGHACWEIFQDTSRILADRNRHRRRRHPRGRARGARSPRLPPDPLARISRPCVRRPAYLDGPDMRLRGCPPRVARREGPHHGEYPQIKDAIIHIEPPPKGYAQ